MLWAGLEQRILLTFNRLCVSVPKIRLYQCKFHNQKEIREKQNKTKQKTKQNKTKQNSNQSGGFCTMSEIFCLCNIPLRYLDIRYLLTKEAWFGSSENGDFFGIFARHLLPYLAISALTISTFEACFRPSTSLLATIMSILRQDE
jgi:hypothetical protein